MINQKNNKVKPFLKWAGGKTQLLNEIEKSLPFKITNTDFTYVEPFVGSGAVLFWMLNNFPNMEKAVINDISSDLINCYRIIQCDVNELIYILKNLEKEYYNFKENTEGRKEYYYSKREIFNSRTSDKLLQAALFIFLNRTCFNGLYRVNRNNKFNVPIGSYITPMICDENNLIAVRYALEKVEILNGDFSDTDKFISSNSFFYFDPPYKPLSKTSSFNSYSKDEFDDSQQVRLRDFCLTLNNKGCNWMLSNSDVKSNDPENNFFDNLYSSFNISRIKAKRSINANPNKRGELCELLITNYIYEQIVSVA